MLYPHKVSLDASPKAISGRTSYLRVRLAFHPYPQLIHALFNALWFGPPRRVNIASPWPWIDHPVSGLQQQTKPPFLDSLSLRLRPSWLNLACCRNSLAHSTKGTLSSLNALQLLVNIGFQVLFHSPPGGSFHLSLTVLLHYRSPVSI